jgi:hypothetical protein
VLAAPILFFLRTPVGDVLNAFARDQVSGMVTNSGCRWLSATQATMYIRPCNTGSHGKACALQSRYLEADGDVQ